MAHDSEGMPEGLPEVLQAPSKEPDELEQAPKKVNKVLKGVGIVVTGLVAGAIGVATIQGSSGSNASSVSSTSSTTNSQQQGPGGGFGGAPGGPGGGAGGVVGETRFAGTLSAVGSSSITVKVTAGSSTTIPVNGTTEILRNGATATLADLRTGEQVFVHVIPSGSSTVAERIFAGTLGGRGFGGPPPGQQGQTGTTSGTGTISTT